MAKTILSILVGVLTLGLTLGAEEACLESGGCSEGEEESSLLQVAGDKKHAEVKPVSGEDELKMMEKKKKFGVKPSQLQGTLGGAHQEEEPDEVLPMPTEDAIHSLLNGSTGSPVNVSELLQLDNSIIKTKLSEVARKEWYANPEVIYYTDGSTSTLNYCPQNQRYTLWGGSLVSADWCWI
jgi:hypothetical protein